MLPRLCRHREHTKSGSPQHHRSAQNQSGQALRAALTSIATSSGPLGPVGFGISSVSGQSSRAPQSQPPQPMSSTQSQHPVDLHATTTYVDEFDCEDAVSEPYELQASRPQFLNSSGPTYSRAHPNATTPTPSHICEPVQCGELGGGQGPEVDFAQPAPAQIAHVEQHQVPPTRPAPSPGDIDAGGGSTLTKEDLTDFAAQMKSVRFPPSPTHRHPPHSQPVQCNCQGPYHASADAEQLPFMHLCSWCCAWTRVWACSRRGLTAA